MAVDFSSVVRELMDAGMTQGDIAEGVRQRVPGCKISQASICRISKDRQGVSFTVGLALIEMHKHAVKPEFPTGSAA